MAKELVHLDAGAQLTAAEDNALDRHYMLGGVTNDMLVYDATNAKFIGKTRAEVLALLSGQAAAVFTFPKGLILTPMTQPGSATEGELVYNSATDKLNLYTGSSWVVIPGTAAGGADFTGKMTQAWTTSEATAGEQGFAITTTDSVVQTAGIIQSLLVDYNITGAKSGTAQTEAISVDMNIGANVNYAYPFAAYVSQTGNPNISGFLAGAQIYLEDMGSGTLSAIAGLDIQIGSTNLASSRHTGIRLVSHTGTAKSGIMFEKAWTVGIDFSGTGSGGVAATFATADIRFQGGTTLKDDGTSLTLSGAKLVGDVDVSSNTLTLAADQISGDKVEGGTIASTTITTLSCGTLNGVGTIDATTEATIETAIDTLANLTSVQGHTLTLTGNFIRSGAHSLTLTTTNTTDVTLPTTGTLATLAGTEEFTNKTLNASVAKGTWTASGTWTIPAVTLNGAVTGGSQVINSLGHLGIGAAADVDLGIYIERTLTDTDNSGKAGLRANMQFAKTAAAMTSAGWGVYGQAILDSTNTQNWSHADAGLRGICGYIGTETGSTGTVSNAASVFANAAFTDSATVTNWHGLHICTPSVAGNKLTNEYGVYVSDMNTGATLNYAIYTNAGLVRFGGAVTLASTLTLGGAVTGGDHAFTGVGDMTFTAGSILAAGSTNTNTLLIKAGGLSGTTFITLTSGDTDTMILGKAFFYDAGGEYIESNGTNLTIASGALINLTASSDVVIPVNIGLHFGDGAEKIESNNTDLTINSGVDINLTATADINIPQDIGLTFGSDSFKIEADADSLNVTGAVELGSTLKLGGTVSANAQIIEKIGFLAIGGNTWGGYSANAALFIDWRHQNPAASAGMDLVHTVDLTENSALNYNGIYPQMVASGTANFTSTGGALKAVNARCYVTDAYSGTIASIFNTQIITYVGGGTVTSMIDCLIGNAEGSGGSISEHIGLKINEHNRASDNTGIYVVNNLNIFRRSDAATNTVLDCFSLRRSTTDTAAAGLGIGVSAMIEDSAGNLDTAASIDFVWQTATSTSEDADIVFKLMEGGSAKAERARFLANGGLTITGAFTQGAGTTTIDTGLTGVIRADSGILSVDALNVTRNIILTAAGGWPSTTNGCSANTLVEYGTNDQDLYHLDFATGADKFAQWTTVLPDDYNAGTVTAIFYWTCTGGGSAETVKWYLQGFAYADDAPIDSTWGTAVGVADTWIADGDVHVTAATGAITIGGGPAAGELCQWRVYRDVSEDDLGVDARLLAVKIIYTGK